MPGARVPTGRAVQPILAIPGASPATITNTGGRPTCPNPSGTSIGGNHRSHCANSPGEYVVREAGSGGRNSGRSSRTRSFKIVNECVQPIRSAITVAGILGHAVNSSRTCGSTPSTNEPLAGRSYFGGLSAANARRTAFRDTPVPRTIALTGIPSARCSLRISAQSSTLSTPHDRGRGSIFTRR